MKNNALFKYYQMMGKKDSGGGNGDYIKDGLIFHLDGINKGNDPTAWTDLIKGIKFTYHDCVLNQNNVEFDGSKSYADLADQTYRDSITLSLDSLYTVEVAFEYDKLNLHNVILFPNAKAAGFIFNTDRFLSEIGVETSRAVAFKNTHRNIISCNSTIGIQNKEIKNANRYDGGYVTSGGNYSIGCRLKGSTRQLQFTGKIYSIRLYNRKLLEEEMLHNQEVDNQRFNLGIESPKYIQFEDPEVAKICVQNFSSDGVGVTYEDAEKVTTLKKIFQGNTKIIKFNELSFFSSIKVLGEEFKNCYNLSEVKLPPYLETISDGSLSWSAGCFSKTKIESVILPSTLIKIGECAFYLCENLKDVVFNKNINIIGRGAFFKCTQLNNLKNIIEVFNNIQEVGDYAFPQCKVLPKILDMPNLKVLGITSFYNSNIQAIKNLGSIKEIPWTFEYGEGGYGRHSTFSTCIDLVDVHLPSTLEKIGGNQFYGCQNLKNIFIDATIPPVLAFDIFKNTNNMFSIYVPDSSVEAYKAAPNWSTYADKIKPLSTYVEPTNN